MANKGYGLAVTLLSVPLVLGLFPGERACAGPPPAEGPPAAPLPAPRPALLTSETLPIDLPTALRLVNISNPTIALAQARAAEAYYRMREAELAWLPDLRGGPAYTRHDGEIQNAAGLVFGTSKQSFFTGGGAALSWGTGDIYFGPLIARRLAQAEQAAAQAVAYDVQLEAALTYLELVRVYAALAINKNILGRVEQMVQSARAGEKAGMGKTPADINRALTELGLRRTERAELQGEVGVVSARLAQLLLLQPTVRLRPEEPPVVPMVLVPLEQGMDDLVAEAFANRPELRQSRLLEEAAETRWQQARISPFVPRLEVLYSGGLFGGGQNDQMSHFSGRSDGLAQAIWELHNLGAGDVAEARARRAVVSQANFHIAEVQARVAAEVAAAASVVVARHEALADSQETIRQATEMWRRLEKASFGMADRKLYDPLEPLLAEQALAQARLRYLNDVIEFNKAQFRLYWAMGQPPICAALGTTPLPVEVPVVPGPYVPAELKMPKRDGQPK
jgi:outer membrane protein TolC